MSEYIKKFYNRETQSWESLYLANGKSAYQNAVEKGYIGTEDQFSQDIKNAATLASSKQDKLVSGSNIKTINGETILGSGDILITGSNTIVKYAKTEGYTTPPTVSSSTLDPGLNWTLTVPSYTPGVEFIWSISARLNSDGSLYSNWSDPVLISGIPGAAGTNGTNGINGINGADGVAGQPGVDGKSIEFIFKLANTVPDTPVGENTDDFVPEGWTDNQSGVTAELQGEYVSSRVKVEGTWGEFNAPKLWAKYSFNGANGENGAPGTDGKDGTDYEFIFTRTTDSTKPSTPATAQTDDFIPEGWTDNAVGVTSIYRYEWVSKRYKVNGVWSAFSSPSSWANYSLDGKDIVTKYTKTITNTQPVFVSNVADPGSIWGDTIPTISSTDVVGSNCFIWNIMATFRDNYLIGEWTGPNLMSGLQGAAGTPPNYKTYVYQLSESKPTSKPTFNTPTPPEGSSWVDYPGTTGTWWQCIGTVSGITNTVSEWSEILVVNGRDGTAQDGKFTEFRFAVSNDRSTAPDIINTNRSPGAAWSTIPPVKGTTQFMWMTVATINPNDTISVNWSTPTCISGEKGATGATGEQGIQGLQGLQGEQGEQGIPGVNGANGETTYFHVKYSDYSDGTSMNETGGKYIGSYVDYTEVDSTDKTKYTWVLVKGAQGERGDQGIAGINGENGRTSYLHIAYADSADGQTNFSVSDSTSKLYIGQYTDFEQTDSSDPTKYKWAQIKGEQGIQGLQGPQGVAGPAGADGVTYYTWIRYADTSAGVGISNDPTGKLYIGFAYNKTTAIESNTPSDYIWSLIKGEQGDTGVQGAAGANGITYYTWIKYSDNSDGTGLYDTPTANTQYIGIAVNKATPTESTVKTDYTWSKFKGDTGATGVGISSTTITYQASSSGTVVPTGTWLSTIPSISAGQYLWTRTIISYTNSTSSTAYSVGMKGEKGATGADGTDGTNGVGIASTTVTYQASSSGTVAPTGTWASSIPSVSPSQYLWTRTVWTYTDSTTATGYSVGMMGATGATGATGAQGIQGPIGNTGPTGSQGVAGVPGIDIKIVYCIGTSTATDPTVSTLTSEVTPEITGTGWSTTIPQTTTTYPYIWFSQARLIYDTTTETKKIEGTWPTPVRLSGINGLPGANGKSGQIIYPEGLYSIDITYTMDEKKAPYVFDSSDNNYYILNATTWTGNTKNSLYNKPSTDTTGSWVKVESFEAIYAKIGIIANGLIGSAVFNEDYMFSQQGIDGNGFASSQYQYFNPTNPRTPNTGETIVFIPNIMFNFKTGNGWLSAGKIEFKNGKVTATDLTVKGKSIQELTTVGSEEDGRGLLTTLNASIVQHDTTCFITISIVGKDNEFELGKAYDGRILNPNQYYAELTLSNETATPYANSFYSNIMGGDDIRDGKTVLATTVYLGANCSLEYLFIPESKTSIGDALYHYNGSFIIKNRSDFYFTGNEFNSKGIGYAYLSYEPLFKCNITVNQITKKASLVVESMCIDTIYNISADTSIAGKIIISAGSINQAENFRLKSPIVSLPSATDGSSVMGFGIKSHLDSTSTQLYTIIYDTGYTLTEDVSTTMFIQAGYNF